MYGYKMLERRCVPFTYHGYGGNGNRFFNMRACSAACY
ncbi:hypothetical protein EG68_12638 [Paragonimus skrjabini miyazakii]|uniref:BPTI/Kunitz inhibitor domain-containing protein n=1 Tax=Paragonimus skrjabini miyazakii TaxID=59628 RepID=A0A8S9YHV3_9TREM|nr:hypothetical protein EG68_12638 [Paragonimus skrjabini miyazakii]